MKTQGKKRGTLRSLILAASILCVSLVNAQTILEQPKLELKGVINTVGKSCSVEECFVNNCKIYLYDYNFNLVDCVSPNEDGSFSIGIEANSSYIVQISKPGFHQKQIGLTLSEKFLKSDEKLVFDLVADNSYPGHDRKPHHEIHDASITGATGMIH